MDAEARFLESSRARLQSHREKHEQVRRSIEERNKFWESLRSYLEEWSRRLEALERNHDDRSGAPASEEDTRRVQMELSELKHDLEELRRRSLSSNVLAEEGTSGPSAELPSPTDCLTFADLRHLFDELQKHQQKLEKTKKQILPKPTFIFKRYRQAVELLRQQGHDITQLESVRLPKVCTAAPRRDHTTGPHARDDSAVHGLDGVGIVVDERGTLCVKSLQGSGESEPPIETRQIDVGSSLVLRDISNSRIELYGCYPSIHLLNVTQSSLQVQDAVSGAVHITDCHRCRVELTAQQLRLHESTDLDLQASAAVILEGCRRIRFRYPSTAAPPDVQDFSFLREGVPSPNFSLEPIVAEKPGALSPKTLASGTDGDTGEATGNTSSDTVEPEAPPAVSLEEIDNVPSTSVCDSDEDEL